MRLLSQPIVSALVLGVGLIAIPGPTAASPSPSTAVPEAPAVGIDPGLAGRYFTEARILCERDGGALWGVSLCGPMILVDPDSRAVAANRADPEGRLTARGALFTGSLPETMNVANTATDWAGARWTMLIWPLPEERQARARLLMHEMWHRVQNELGFPATMPANAHLDSGSGRLWLRLEWRALRTALGSAGETRREATRDALIFRAARRKEFPEAAVEERALELNEGLAAYTGLRLAGETDPARFAVELLSRYDRRDSLVRAFAYVSGPAYGLLLDGAAPGWPAGFSADDDLGERLRSALQIWIPEDPGSAARAIADCHDGAAIGEEEETREGERRERLAGLRSRLIDAPLLVIPLEHMDMQFNPNNLQPLDDAGTVYPDIRIVDAWGILTVTGGALMHPRFDRIDVPAPADPARRPIHGDGWTLELEQGWTIGPGARAGDYTLRKIE